MIVARPLFGYRSLVHLCVILLAVAAMLLLHGALTILLAGAVVVLMGGLAVLSFTPRVIFGATEIVYRDAFGRAAARWTLDGSAQLHVVHTRIATRWGRIDKLGTLRLVQSEHYPQALDLLLPSGVYSRQAAWAQRLITAAEDGCLAADPQALAALVRYAG